MDKFVNRKISSRTGSNKLPFHSCLLLNISSCEYSEQHETFVVTVYNPTSHVLSTYVRIPVPNKFYKITDRTGKCLQSQIVPIAESVLKIPGRISSAVNELIFKAEEIPALGYLSFYIDVDSADSSKNFLNTDDKNHDAIEVSFGDGANIKIRSKDEEKLSFEMSFHYYKAFPKPHTDDAYIFRPRNENAENFETVVKQMKIFKGPHVKEYQWSINDWISGSIRLYAHENYIESDWIVGPIPTSDGDSKDVIARFITDLKTNEVFYTDSNGREMMERKRNFRPTWNVSLEEPVAGNYYPVATKISIVDKEQKTRFSVITDRAQGGSSLRDGELELMIHRRSLNVAGNGEALNEVAFDKGIITRGQHLIHFGDYSQSSDVIHYEKVSAMQTTLKPLLTFTPLENCSFQNYKKLYIMKHSELKKKIPKNANILTLEPWRENEVLLRLEHLYEDEESVEYSKPLMINIANLFSGFNIVDLEEMTLGANQHLKELNRLKWKTSVTENTLAQKKSAMARNLEYEFFDVSLKPMEIRTFVVQVSEELYSYDEILVIEDLDEPLSKHFLGVPIPLMSFYDFSLFGFVILIAIIACVSSIRRPYHFCGRRNLILRRLFKQT